MMSWHIISLLQGKILFGQNSYTSLTTRTKLAVSAGLFSQHFKGRFAKFKPTFYCYNMGSICILSILNILFCLVFHTHQPQKRFFFTQQFKTDLFAAMAIAMTS